MDRKQFLRLGLATCGLALPSPAAGTTQHPLPDPGELEGARRDADFVRAWVSDLVDAMESQLPAETRIGLVEACGRGCFRRHAFKREMAAEGSGDPEKLIAAYARRFECWRDEAGDVHVRYGETSRRCYCPVVKGVPARPDDLHCECTRGTHRAVFEAALGRPIRVDVIETLRRGGRTCHFVARLG